MPLQQVQVSGAQRFAIAQGERRKLRNPPLLNPPLDLGNLAIHDFDIVLHICCEHLAENRADWKFPL